MRNGERVSACRNRIFGGNFTSSIIDAAADKGDGFTFVPPVDAETFVIHSDDAVAGVKLAHADEAKIG
jgi:hypothetical protein